MTLREAEKKFGASLGTLKNWVKTEDPDKKIPFIQPGGARNTKFVKPEDVEKALRRNPQVQSIFKDGPQKADEKAAPKAGDTLEHFTKIEKPPHPEAVTAPGASANDPEPINTPQREREAPQGTKPNKEATRQERPSSSPPKNGKPKRKISFPKLRREVQLLPANKLLQLRDDITIKIASLR